ncbi:MAG: cyclomaltodextrinase C-terminal domain-containing protein, partial [Ignavibacterium sp.]
DYENDLFNFTKKLIWLRKEFKSMSQGELYHYYPFNNVYVYFRKLNDETTMIVANGSDKEQIINFSDYKEMLSSSKKLIDLLSDDEISLNEEVNLSIRPFNTRVFLLEK